MGDLVISDGFFGAVLWRVYLVPCRNVLHFAHESMKLGAHGINPFCGPTSCPTYAFILPAMVKLVLFDEVWSAAAVIYILGLHL